VQGDLALVAGGSRSGLLQVPRRGPHARPSRHLGRRPGGGETGRAGESRQVLDGGGLAAAAAVTTVPLIVCPQCTCTPLLLLLSLLMLLSLLLLLATSPAALLVS